ncbi:acyl-CoA thioesterase [Parablastomonas sp. CN1-191]|uniref:acyl-CoA thioesterase n=1 Tax=Parablastomonas sp. CN1-191 TaxID=3400908 RepID=UPI003BF7A5B1
MVSDTPSPEELVAGFVRLLSVRPAGEDRFAGRRKPGGVGRVFGGQVIAQALAAAEATVDEGRPCHSLHAYFLRGGSEDHEIDFAVNRDFDGASFANRRVVASQEGRPILNLTASFQRPEQGLHHVDTAMPDVPAPETLPSEFESRRKLAEGAPAALKDWLSRPRPVEMRMVERESRDAGVSAQPLAHAWIRVVAPLGDDPRLHRAALAFATDLGLLGTSLMPHGLSWLRGEVISASLDHAIWFHGAFRADDWLLYSMHSPWTGNGRGFNTGQIFTRDGRLVASVAQEGMIRRARSPASPA